MGARTDVPTAPLRGVAPLRGIATPVRRVAHPVAVAALLVLVVNDHVLKAAWGGPVTGKLSDVAGLLLFPALLVDVLAIIERRRTGRRLPDPRDGTRAALRPDRAATVAVLATAVGFTVVKTSPGAAEVAGWVLAGIQHPLTLLRSVGTGAGVGLLPSTPAPIVVDGTDLVALAALVPAWFLARGPAATRRGVGHPSRVHTSPRRALGAAAVGVALLGTTATSKAEDPAVKAAPTSVEVTIDPALGMASGTLVLSAAGRGTTAADELHGTVSVRASVVGTAPAGSSGTPGGTDAPHGSGGSVPRTPDAPTAVDDLSVTLYAPELADGREPPPLFSHVGSQGSQARIDIVGGAKGSAEVRFVVRVPASADPTPATIVRLDVDATASWNGSSGQQVLTVVGRDDPTPVAPTSTPARGGTAPVDRAGAAMAYVSVRGSANEVGRSTLRVDVDGGTGPAIIVGPSEKLSVSGEARTVDATTCGREDCEVGYWVAVPAEPGAELRPQVRAAVGGGLAGADDAVRVFTPRVSDAAYVQSVSGAIEHTIPFAVDLAAGATPGTSSSGSKRSGVAGFVVQGWGDDATFDYVRSQGSATLAVDPLRLTDRTASPAAPRAVAGGCRNADCTFEVSGRFSFTKSSSTRLSFEVELWLTAVSVDLDDPDDADGPDDPDGTPALVASIA